MSNTTRRQMFAAAGLSLAAFGYDSISKMNCTECHSQPQEDRTCLGDWK